MATYFDILYNDLIIYLKKYLEILDFMNLLRAIEKCELLDLVVDDMNALIVYVNHQQTIKCICYTCLKPMISRIEHYRFGRKIFRECKACNHTYCHDCSQISYCKTLHNYTCLMCAHCQKKIDFIYVSRKMSLRITIN